MALSQYLNQHWSIVNWTLRNKIQRNFNRNSNIFIQQNAHETVICDMVSILSQPQWVNAHSVWSSNSLDAQSATVFSTPGQKAVLIQRSFCKAKCHIWRFTWLHGLDLVEPCLFMLVKAVLLSVICQSWNSMHKLSNPSRAAFNSWQFIYSCCSVWDHLPPADCFIWASLQTLPWVLAS